MECSCARSDTDVCCAGSYFHKIDYPWPNRWHKTVTKRPPGGAALGHTLLLSGQSNTLRTLLMLPWFNAMLTHAHHGIHNAILEFEGRVYWQWRSGLRSCVTLGSYLVTQLFFTNTALSLINFTITEHWRQGVCVGAITGLRVHPLSLRHKM